MSTPLLVTTTFERREDAERMATVLVGQRLAACAQIVGPISSTYWWQEKIVSSEEYQLVVKSDEHVYSRLEQTILAKHPYETPEIVAVAPTHVDVKYQQWLCRELQI